MSTSDQDPTTGFTERVRPAMPVDETTIAPMGSLPDVAMLSRLANEFFRAQPGQGFPTSVAPYSPKAQDMTPAFETRLPEFGMPLPSMPAIPSAGSVPIAPNASQFSTGVPELAPFTMGPAAAMSLPHDCARSGNGHVLPARSARCRSRASGVSVCLADAGVWRAVSVVRNRCAGAPAASAPADGGRCEISIVGHVSVLLPGKCRRPQRIGHISCGSDFGRCATVLQYDPRSAAAVMPSSPFSMPMPEFDRALFPSFEEGVPELAPLPPLRNENEARAALTDPSSFYFLDERSLLEAPLRQQRTVASCGDRRSQAPPAADGYRLGAA